MIVGLVVTELSVIGFGTVAAIIACYDCKRLVRNRIRAHRFSKEVSKLNDIEHIAWAANLVIRPQHLVVTRHDTP